MMRLLLLSSEMDSTSSDRFVIFCKAAVKAVHVMETAGI